MCPSLDKEKSHGSPRRRCLVVDDEQTLRLGFSYALANRSTQVDTAANGSQALEKLKNESYDILILDLRMPDISGLQIIETLRQAGNPVSIVLCSAAMTASAALRSIQQRVPDFLLKPVRPVDLREIVNYVLSPPDTPVSRAMVALRAGNIPEALEHVRSTAAHHHGASVWMELLESLISPPEEEPFVLRERLIRSSLASLAFRANGSSP